MNDSEKVIEINFDGLIGPSHHYAGLSYGNIASTKHANQVSNPKAAALQGLAKMELLLNLGVKQAILPPQPRPNLALLRELGFSGPPSKMIKQAAAYQPQLLAAVYSAASMWTANAATISPNCDTLDHKIHFTPANLSTHLHRAQEAIHTGKILANIFSDPNYFVHHPPLSSYQSLRDEGAANFLRLCQTHATPGIEIFIYGANGLIPDRHRPKIYGARQTLLASSTIARLHKLDPEKTVYVQQHPDAIDSGVFHNDVISLANENVWLVHEKAYLNTDAIVKTVKNKFRGKIFVIKVNESRIPLSLAVKTYLFNSQLVTLADGSMAFIAPIECALSKTVNAYLTELCAEPNNPIQAVHYVDVRQSMHNGGGPACLRLRVSMTKKAYAASKQTIYLTPTLLQQLRSWVSTYYRNRLTFKDLLDTDFIMECQTAQQVLADLLQFPEILEN